jgi:hypothetical protein
MERRIINLEKDFCRLNAIRLAMKLATFKVGILSFEKLSTKIRVIFSSSLSSIQTPLCAGGGVWRGKEV